MGAAIKSLCLCVAFTVLAAGRAAAVGGCTVHASALDFGGYNPLGSAPARSVGTITYQCLGRPPAGIKIILSSGQSGMAGIRSMTAGSARLPYLLCLDPNCLEPWGDGANGTAVYQAFDPPPGRQVTIHVYGLIPRHQKVPANPAYRDTVAVIAEF